MISSEVKRGHGVLSRWLIHASFVAIAGFVLIFAVWNYAVVPSWLRGEWDPENKLMRYLYQCQGTPEQESIRWEPDHILVSACKRPILIAESDNGRRVLILNRADAQYVVLEPVSGQIVYSVSARDYSVISLVGDRYLYATAVPSEARLPRVAYMIDVETGVAVAMRKVEWDVKDLTPLVQAYERSRGNVIRVNRDPHALLFIYSTNDFAAYKLTNPIQTIVNDLIGKWDTAELRAYVEMKENASVAGGVDDCVIGENKYVGDENPISQPRYAFCMYRFALPVVTEP